jgi:hypothetical protein
MEEGMRKIRYKHTGLELGEVHTEMKDLLYMVWGHISDEQLEKFGLERVPEEKK